ncbi:MAG: MmcQ/YjbR family DNA-binding protein [Planctomycetota bacterium]|nr:MmcQ/YjbR family DNA-binding protein [Planctomycetota bacterium]
MTRKGRPGAASRKHEAALRRIAMGYPETVEEFPWGHSAFKVRRKVFLFLACDEDGLGVSVKLPYSNREALLLPFAEPTHYGLGKSGWVSARFAPDETPPIAILREWIDESYRVIAPKKLVAALDGDPRPARKVRKKA